MFLALHHLPVGADEEPSDFTPLDILDRFGTQQGEIHYVHLTGSAGTHVHVD